MAQIIKGTSRVTLFPMLHTWPDLYGVGAYASTGHFGTTAIVGYIPIPEVPDMSWLHVAARHLPSASGTDSQLRWALCTAWSARSVMKPGSIDVEEAAWSLEVEAASTDDDVRGYGHTSVRVGRFYLEDEQLAKQGIALLPSTQA